MTSHRRSRTRPRGPQAGHDSYRHRGRIDYQTCAECRAPGYRDRATAKAAARIDYPGSTPRVWRCEVTSSMWPLWHVQVPT